MPTLLPSTLRSHRLPLDTSAQRLGFLEPVPEGERSDRAALQARLARDGYLYLKGALNPARVLAFREMYFRTLAETGLIAAGSPPLEGLSGDEILDPARVRRLLFDEIVRGEAYEALCTCEEIKGFYTWFLDRKVHLHKRKLIRHHRPQDTWTTPAHYDLVYLRGGTTRLLSSWIPLGDCPAERGGLTYLEGSHVWCEAFDRQATKKMVAESITYDLRALAETHQTRWLIAAYEAGDMVVHSPYIVHASLDNDDTRGVIRLSTDIRYQRLDDAIDPRWQNHWREDDGL
ncbi:phytanoyl-CoA dioxygenase family protein [Deinococcus oregonensis]|uniref:Phytanoyl-CoA dioxygenase family protein n=1 Tax=Deinococcus oregonensis TaxID=1805970 RepID=A0ABV6AV81_9DEIO